MACAICATISLGVTSPRRSLQHTRDSNETSRLLSLLCLAPDGGCLAACITANAGGLLHHHFTITCPPQGWTWLFVSVALFRQVAPPRMLSDVALYGVRTFLDPAEAEPRLPNQPESFHHTRVMRVRQRSNSGHLGKRH